MKSEPLSYSLIGGGIVAFAWALSSTRLAVGLESLVGYAAVAAIAAMLFSEYRVSGRKLNVK